MKKLLLASLILLNGCAFDDMMTSVNKSLSTANNTLSGNGQLQSKNKVNDDDNTIDCKTWIEKANAWNNGGKDKIYSNDPATQVKISRQKFDEMSNIKYKIHYYACRGYKEPFFNPNKEYLDKIELEQAQEKINKNKGKK